MKFQDVKLDTTYQMKKTCPYEGTCFKGELVKLKAVVVDNKENKAIVYNVQDKIYSVVKVKNLKEVGANE